MPERPSQPDSGHVAPVPIPESMPVSTTVLVLVVAVVAAVVGYVGMRRPGESAGTADRWDRTDEVFRDPSTGRVMRVWLDPVDGTRRYVPEPGSR